MAKLLLVAILSGMFLHAVYAILVGEVFCKGRWYSRESEKKTFWFLVIMYLSTSPVLLYFGLSTK